MNEDNAIKFLRGLLNSPATTRDDGKPDPGWCCNEHSVVACLAFIICGQKALLCSGSLMIGGAESCTILGVDPHEFVIVSGSGVFDSSVSFESVLGIPSDSRRRHPRISVRGGEHVPTKKEFVATLQRLPNQQTLAWYSSSKMSIPNQRTIRWTSSTPFGEWLTGRYGSQVGMWSKAAWITADILRGGPSPSGIDRDALWDFTASTPDRDEAVLDACFKFTNET